MDDRLLQLLKAHGHKKGTFTLASGKQSDFYIDVRRVALSAMGHQLLGEALLKAIHTPVYAVAGVALGGCPLASSVALTSENDANNHYPLDAIYIRKQAKGHGTGNLLEVPFGVPSACKVVLVEDVITTGGSSERAVAALREGGFQVDQVVVVVDRLEGGREHLEGLGLEVTALYTRDDFMKPSCA